MRIDLLEVSAILDVIANGREAWNAILTLPDSVFCAMLRSLEDDPWMTNTDPIYRSYEASL